MNPGIAIKLLRVSQGLRAQDLSKMLGITSSYLSLVEADKRVPSDELFDRAASALHVPVELLALLASGDASRATPSQLADIGRLFVRGG